MRKYYCDICGREMLGPMQEADLACEAVAAAHVADVCNVCLAVGRKINVRHIILRQWREMVESTASVTGASVMQPACKPQSAVESVKRDRPSVPGKRDATMGGKAMTGMTRGGHWAEKRRIMAELTAYREKNGLGSLRALANVSDVDADILRQMLNAQSYPIDVWQRVDEGLKRLAENQE